jgi:hypothetical protein
MSIAGPPTNPTTAIAPNSTSEPMLRIFGPCRRRAMIIAMSVIATAIVALHATPFASSRCATSEKTIQGRKPRTNLRLSMPPTLSDGQQVRHPPAYRRPVVGSPQRSRRPRRGTALRA